MSIPSSQTHSVSLLSLPRGSVYTFSLPSNSTTGYSWVIDNIGEGIQIREQKKYQSSNRITTRFPPGSGGKEIFSYIVLQPEVVKIDS